MPIKDQAVNLVLKAKNLLSGETDAAADSVENLAGSAEALKERLRSLEDQGRLVKQFAQAEKAVDRTGKAWDAAKIRVTKLQEQIEKSGKATDSQAAALELASKTAAKAEAEYKKQEKVLADLADEAEEAGIDLKDLNKTQQGIAKETVKAKRALQDFNEEVDQGSGKVLAFRKGLSQGVTTFVKWGSAAAAAGAAITVGVLTRLTKEQADLARQTLATSEALGLSTEALQSWQYAAETVGIEGDKTADILKDVSEKLGDAFLAGGGEAREVVEGLGLSLEKLIKLSPDEQLLAISKELDRLGDQSNKVFVLETLASDASLLLPLLENNAQKLKELQAQAEKRGILISDEDLKRLKETDDAFRKVGDQLSKFQQKLAADLAPTFTKIAEDFENFLGKNPKLIEDITGALGGLIVKAEEWVSSVLDNKEEILGTFQTIADTAEFLGRGFEALFRGTQAFAAGSLEVLTRVGYSAQDLYTTVVTGLNKIGLASDKTVEQANFKLQNLGATVQDLEAQADKYKEQMIEAGTAAVNAFDNTSQGAQNAQGVIQQTVQAAKDLVGANEDVGQAAQTSQAQTEQLALSQAQLGQAIAETVVEIQKAQAAWEEDPTPENLKTLEALRDKYAQLQEQLQGFAKNVKGPKDAGLVDQFRETTGAIEETAKAATNAANQISAVGDAAEGTAGKVEQAGDAATSSADSIGGAIAAVFEGWADRVDSLSSKARNFFNRELGFKQAIAEAGTLDSRLKGIEDTLAKMREKVTGNKLTKIFKEWARAGLETERAFISQSIAVEKLTERILEGNGSAKELQYTAEDLERKFDLLDGSQLRPLIGAISSAKREMDALGESLIDTVNAAEQELAALRGNQERVEELRYLEREAELQSQLEQAKLLGDQESIKNAQKALDLTKEAYQLRKRQARERDAEDAKRRAELEADRASRRQDDEQEERQEISQTQQRTQTQTTQLDRAISNQTVTLRIEGDGSTLGVLDGLDPRQVEDLIQAIQNSSFLTTG